MIKIGQIGIGHNHASEIMRTVRKLTDRFTVVGLAESNQDWLKARGGLPAYQDLPILSEEEVIARSDAILVETDVGNLTRTAQRCIDAGRHVHMDKPASGSLDDFGRLLRTAKSKDLVMQLGYMYRYNRAMQECFEKIKKGEIGEIYSINAEMSTAHPASYREWLKQFPGGPMYIFGSHMLDLIIYLLGEPENVKTIFKHTGFGGVDVADNNLAVLEYEKAIARIYVSSVEVNGYGHRQFSVSGSKGSMHIMPMEHPTVYTWSDLTIADDAYADKKKIHMLDDTDRYEAMLTDFYDCIVGEKKSDFTYEHDYLVQKILCQMIGI